MIATILVPSRVIEVMTWKELGYSRCCQMEIVENSSLIKFRYAKVL